MNLQLSNDDDNQVTTPVRTKEDFKDDNFDPAAEDTVFIANQYRKPDEGIHLSKDAHYLATPESFPPVLMLFGAGVILFAIFYYGFSMDASLFQLVNSGELMGNMMTVSIMSFLGSGLIIADAIIMCKKGISSGSLIAWAVICPIVYFFKRCKDNGNTVLIAFIIIVAHLGATIYTTNEIFHAYAESMHIEINDSGFQGFTLTSVAMEDLSKMQLYIGSHGPFNYDTIIYYNVQDATYQFVTQTSPQPDLLVIEGTTTIHGIEEDISIQLEYDSFDFHQITIGDSVYYSNEQLTDILYEMVKQIPGA